MGEAGTQDARPRFAEDNIGVRRRSPSWRNAAYVATLSVMDVLALMINIQLCLDVRAPDVAHF